MDKSWQKYKILVKLNDTVNNTAFKWKSHKYKHDKHDKRTHLSLLEKNISNYLNLQKLNKKKYFIVLQFATNISLQKLCVTKQFQL